MSQLDLFVPEKGESHRQKRVAEEIRFQLAQALSRGDLPPVRSRADDQFLSLKAPLTITHVTVSADLRHATVLITSLGGFEKDKSLEFIQLQRGCLRKMLGAKMKLRYTPDLHFKWDDGIEQASHMMQKIADVIAKDEALSSHHKIDNHENVLP